jgi:hypothetical protein
MPETEAGRQLAAAVDRSDGSFHGLLAALDSIQPLGSDDLDADEFAAFEKKVDEAEARERA